MWERAGGLLHTRHTATHVPHNLQALEPGLVALQLCLLLLNLFFVKGGAWMDEGVNCTTACTFPLPHTRTRTLASSATSSASRAACCRCRASSVCRNEGRSSLGAVVAMAFRLKPFFDRCFLGPGFRLFLGGEGVGGWVSAGAWQSKA